MTSTSAATSQPQRSISLAILARAFSADASERAHRTTGPLRAATAARPQAMAPLPATPRRSLID